MARWQTGNLAVDSTGSVDVTAPSVPPPAYKIANDRAHQTSCPVPGMRLGIEGYSANEVAGEAESDDPDVDHQRPIVPSGLGSAPDRFRLLAHCLCPCDMKSQRLRG